MTRSVPRGWKELEIKDFLKFTPRAVEKPKEKYLSLGIRSHCKGTFIREVENPDKVMMETLYAIKKDDLYELGIISPGGAGRNRVLARTDFLHLRFVLPPVSEQKKIAGILNAWDRAIETLDKLIETKTHLKKGLMQQLLTGAKRLRGSNGKWEVKKISDVASVDADNLGNNVSPDFIFNYISLEDVDVGMLKGYSKQIFRNAPSRARRRVKKDDILVATVRPNLQSHLLFELDTPDWICSTGFSVVRCKDQVSHPAHIFFNLFSQTVLRQMKMFMTGSNYPAINGSDVKAIKIPMPNYGEQSRIAKILKDITDEINLLARKRALLDAQKSGLMQKLLTGKIRVKV